MPKECVAFDATVVWSTGTCVQNLESLVAADLSLAVERERRKAKSGTGECLVARLLLLSKMFGQLDGMGAAIGS